jgi:hypothetical protein
MSETDIEYKIGRIVERWAFDILSSREAMLEIRAELVKAYPKRIEQEDELAGLRRDAKRFEWLATFPNFHVVEQDLKRGNFVTLRLAVDHYMDGVAGNQP